MTNHLVQNEPWVSLYIHLTINAEVLLTDSRALNSMPPSTIFHFTDTKIKFN